MDVLDDILGHAANLLLGLEVRHRLKVELRVTLGEAGADALDLLAVLLRRDLVLGPDEVKHASHADLSFVSDKE